MLPFHSILCPLDFSEPSEKALQVAIEMAVHFGAELVLVHVIPAAVQGIPADPAFAFPGPEPYQQALTVNVEERLRAVAQRISSGVKWRTAIGNGDAAGEIIRLHRRTG